jgi:hypothetical protein
LQDGMPVRKAANLAKLLYHLIVDHNVLKLNVLKAIDMSSPEELHETSMIFLTIFLSSVLEHFNDPSAVSDLFGSGISSKSNKKEAGDGFLAEQGEEQEEQVDEGEALRANLTVFFVQVLKASPKYKKGSKFRVNLKAAIKACDPDNFFE